jgi:ketosteroid isomerase-like protein
MNFFAGLVALAAAAATMFGGIRPTGSRADDENTVGALDAQYQEAVKKNDVAIMERILADDFVLVTGNGRMQTKADLPKESSSGEITYEQQEDVCGTTRQLLRRSCGQRAHKKGRSSITSCGSAMCMCARLRAGGTCLDKPRGHWRRGREPAGIAPRFATTKTVQKKDRLGRSE